MKIAIIGTEISGSIQINSIQLGRIFIHHLARDVVRHPNKISLNHFS